MTSKLKKISLRKKAVVIVAHPDDESLFFGGVILEWPHIDWTVVCVTDGNWEKRRGERKKEFLQACKKMGVKHTIIFNLLDDPLKRIPKIKIMRRLKGLGHFDYIFTHNALGEYGHPAHQDVGAAVAAFYKSRKNMYCPQLLFKEKFKVKLSKKNSKIKEFILKKVYSANKIKLLPNDLLIEKFEPITPQINLKIHRHLTRSKKMSKKDPLFETAEYFTELTKKAQFHILETSPTKRGIKIGNG